MILRTVLRCFLSSCALLPALLGHSENGLTHLDAYKRPKERSILMIPMVESYQVMKCDLHQHTVFSDGLVWPTIRVEEAWSEGLDAISITDHVEYQPHREDIPTKHNRGYELSRESAERQNLILIQGTELTRHTPPGHFNAIFISDASGFIEEREKGNLHLDKQAIALAAAQDAFIFWNHPGWKMDEVEGSYAWTPFLQDLHDEGWIDGIEVINGFTFHRKALDWCLDYNLTVLGTSDIHNLVAHEYRSEHGATRSMTLAFVKERSAEGLRDALENRRTIAWSTETLAGSERWLDALFDACVTLEPAHATDERGRQYHEVRNQSDFHWTLERQNPSADTWPETIHLNPRTSQVIRINPAQGPSEASYWVRNAYIRSDRNLLVTLKAQ